MSATLSRTFEGTTPSRLRRAAPLLAGLVTVIALSTIADAILHATHVYPPFPQRMADPMYLLPLGYRVVFTVLGGALTARLSLGRPMRDAMRLGAIGFALGMLGLLATWNADLGPHWYALAVAFTAIPSVWLGARLTRLKSGAPRARRVC